VPETRRPADPAPPARRAGLIHRTAIVPSLVLFAGVAAMGGFFAFVPLHAVGRLGVDDVGSVFLLFGTTVVGVRVVCATLPDRMPPFRIAAVALASCAAGLAVAGALPNPSALLAGTAMLGVGIALITPAVFAAVFARVPPSRRGVASGTVTLFIDLGFGGGPLLLGVIAGLAGIPAAFLVAAALAGLGAVVSAALATGGARRSGRPSDRARTRVAW
jgi:predicted MFS family arabinose efflux permease